jgi:uncharacterized repeat protein (TIGR01451 family)
VPTADLGVTLDDSPDPVQRGSNLTLTATVRNAGPSSATLVTLTENLPSGLTLLSTQGGSCTGSRTIVCPLGTIAANGSVTVKITVLVTKKSGNLTTTASVSATEPDPVTTNNVASTTTRVSSR